MWVLVTTPTPAPYPTSGGAASSWSCRDVAEGDPPVPVGSDCLVTSWGTDPEPVPAPTVTATESTGTAGPAVVGLDSDSLAALGVPLIALVLFAAAAMVQRFKR